MANPFWKLLVRIDRAVYPGNMDDAITPATSQEIWYMVWFDEQDWVCHEICADA